MLQFSELAKVKIRLMLKEQVGKEWAIRLRYEGTAHVELQPIPLKEIKADEKVFVFKRKKTFFNVEDFKIVTSAEVETQLDNALIDYVDGGLLGGAFEVQLHQESLKNRLDFNDPIVKKIDELLKSEINPAIAMHGGFAELLEVKDRYVYLRLAGGCQGCGMADVTLRNGIELRIKEECPEVLGVIDQTNHAGGANPYFQAH